MVHAKKRFESKNKLWQLFFMATNCTCKIRSGEYLITPEALETSNARKKGIWVGIGIATLIVAAAAVYLKAEYTSFCKEVGL